MGIAHERSKPFLEKLEERHLRATSPQVSLYHRLEHFCMTPKRKVRINASVRRMLTQTTKLNEALWSLKEVLGEAGCDSESAVNDCVFSISKAVTILRGHIDKDIEAHA